MRNIILEYFSQKLRGLYRYSIHSPRRASVLVIDKIRDYDMSALLEDVEHTFVEVRGEKLYLGLGVFIALFKINFLEAQNRGEGIFYALLYALSGTHERYVDACICCVQPEVVITLIDNNVNFFNLSSRFPDKTFVAIQLAWRIKRNIVQLLPGNKNHVYYFCFSEHEKVLFPPLGYDPDRIIVSGSMLQSLWGRSPNPSAEHFDICLTSQWRSAFFDEDTIYPTFGKIITYVYESLAKLVEEMGLSCCIATAKNTDEEIAYFKDIFGANVFINNRETGLNTYDLMAASSLVLTVTSTSGREASAMGARVLFWDPPSEASVCEDQVIASPLFLREMDYGVFRARISELLSMSDDEYDLKYGTASRHLMARQGKVSTADHIKEFVQQHIT